MTDTHLSLLAENYIRWRHGLIGSADVDVVTRTAEALSKAVGQDVSLLSDTDLLALVQTGGNPYVSQEYKETITSNITSDVEVDPLLPRSIVTSISNKRTKKGEGN